MNYDKSIVNLIWFTSQIYDTSYLTHKKGLDAIMKYVYAILIVVDKNPIMQTM